MGLKRTQTLEMLRKGQKYECCRSLVFKWHDGFKNGQASLQDDNNNNDNNNLIYRG